MKNVSFFHSLQELLIVDLSIWVFVTLLNDFINVRVNDHIALLKNFFDLIFGYLSTFVLIQLLENVLQILLGL